MASSSAHVEGACEKFPASDLDVQLLCEMPLLHKVIFSLTFFHTMYLVQQNTCLILVIYTLSMEEHVRSTIPSPVFNTLFFREV